MTRISAIIITFNEEDRIGETVSSLGFCDEVVVVDSGSSDRTGEIARQAGARVLRREWTGYSDQKNYASGQAVHDWVFSVDADERPSIELADEIVEWKRREPDKGVVGCSMPRLANYLGRWIRHSGWYPDRKIRLYARDHARWIGDFVHESLQVEGRVQRFRGDLLHFPYRTLDDHHERIDRYTVLAGAESRQNGRRFNPVRLIVAPPLYFLKSFLLRAGFLDGRYGLRLAYMGARYVFLKEFRILS